MRSQVLSSLRTRLLLLVLMAVIPALGLMLYTAAAQRRLAVAQIHDEVVRLAGLASATHGRVVEGARQLLVGLSHYPEVVSKDGPKCHELFAKLLKHYPEYANLGLIDHNGLLIASALPTKAAVDLHDRFYFRQAMGTREFAMGHHQIGRITRKPTVNFAYPILDDGGSVTGVVYAALNLSWFN